MFLSDQIAKYSRNQDPIHIDVMCSSHILLAVVVLLATDSLNLAIRSLQYTTIARNLRNSECGLPLAIWVTRR